MESHARLGIIKRSEAKTGSRKFCSLYRMYIILFYLVPDFTSIKTLSRYTKNNIGFVIENSWKLLKALYKRPVLAATLKWQAGYVPDWSISSFILISLNIDSLFCISDTRLEFTPTTKTNVTYSWVFSEKNDWESQKIRNTVVY